jgi:hypothetical protein
MNISVAGQRWSLRPCEQGIPPRDETCGAVIHALRSAGARRCARWVSPSRSSNNTSPTGGGPCGGGPAIGVDLPTGEPEHPVRALRDAQCACGVAPCECVTGLPRALMPVIRSSPSRSSAAAHADDVTSNRHTAVGSRVTGCARSAFDVRDSTGPGRGKPRVQGRHMTSVACAEWPRVLMVRPHPRSNWRESASHLP